MGRSFDLGQVKMYLIYIFLALPLKWNSLHNVASVLRNFTYPSTPIAMRLTQFTDYTLRVLIYLGARDDDAGLATIGDIANAYGISQNHLMKVVHHLSKHGFVETVRGKGGGMKLARPADQINIGEVVRGAEVDVALVECLQPASGANGAGCAIMPMCELQSLLVRATEAFFAVLDRQTLADLVQPKSQLIEIFRSNAARRAQPGSGRHP